MKNLKYILIALVLFPFKESEASDTASIKYFPLTVGNIFVYNYHSSGTIGNVTYKIKSRVTRDTLIDNKKYFYCVSFPYFTNIWLRTDSTTGSLYMYDSSNSCSFYQNAKLVDSLSSHIYDTIRNCASLFVCVDTNYSSIFGINSNRKYFYISYYSPPPFWSSSNYRKIFIKNFGLTYYSVGFAGMGYFGSRNYNLIGCVINGVVFGDTSTIIIGIYTVSNEVNQNYILHQNYPNPFNPKTVISYSLIENSFVKLKVYDLRGNEVATLVNEKQNDGSYSIDWNGSNLSSGVYFYKIEITANNSSEIYTESKRMILLK